MQLPPQNLSDLHRLLSQIRQHQSPLKLSKNAMTSLTHLLETPRQSALLPIDQLAQNCGVSSSTLSRLATRLGFHGFKQFQGLFKKHWSNDSGFYSNLADKLAHDPEKMQTNASFAMNLARNECTNIMNMVSQLDAKYLPRIVELLAHHHSVRILGNRQSSALASHFCYCLGMLRQHVDLISAPNHGTAHGLSKLNAGDLLISFSCYPYTRSTVTATHIASAKGITVIAITDDEQSPLVDAADYVLITPTNGDFYSNSMASIMVLNEIILSMVAKKLGDNAIQSLRERESIISALEAEFGEQ